MKTLIERETGNILSVCNCDMTSLEMYNESLHEVREDGNENLRPLDRFSSTYHRWNGTGYEEVSSPNHLRKLVICEAERGRNIVNDWIADNVLTLTTEEKNHFFVVFQGVIVALMVGGFTPARHMLESITTDETITQSMIDDILEKIG